MEKIEFDILFTSMSTTELNELKEFIMSPLTFKGKYRTDLIELIDHIINCKKRGQEIDNEVLIKNFKSSKSTNRNYARRIVFELTAASRKYIEFVYIYQKADEKTKMLNLSSAYFDKRSYKKSEQYIKYILNELNKKKKLSIDEQFLTFKTFELKSYNASHQYKKDVDLNLLTSLRNLNISHLMHKIKIINYLLSINETMKTEDYQEEINQIQYEIEKKNIDFSNNYELKIDIEIFNLFISKNVYKEKFIDLINLIDSNEHILDKNIIKYYYYHLRNYCSKLIIFGKYELYPVLNQIYFNHLQKGYLFQDGKILGIIYLNIVNTALKSGDQEWAIKFCEEYKDNIWGNERITNEIYELSLANYYYHTKNFDKAYQILPKHSNDSEINLIIRRLEIRILFETHSDLLPFKIDAFKMYISRSAKNIISESNRVRQSGFINLVLQLTQCTWRDYEKAEKIRQRILAKPQVSERQWLLEMVDNILATRKS